MHEGERRHVTGRPHVDTGFVTLLAQDGVGGLQARRRSGEWIDVPPAEGTLAVNFGIASSAGPAAGSRRRPSRARQRPPALLHPLLLRAAGRCGDLAAALGRHRPFQPFLYGDHLWATTTRFVEFQGRRICASPGATPPPWGRRSATNAGRPRYPEYESRRLPLLRPAPRHRGHRDRPVRPGEIKVKIAACAICHSDIHFMEGAWGGDLPAVFGHEAAGVVESVGAGVTRVKPGDHVVVTLIRSCGHCHYCTQGNLVQCETKFTSI